MVRRRPIVFVGGSSRIPHEGAALPVGTWIARHGCHLLTGGRSGVMESVTRAFVSVEDRAGVAIGILPEGAVANAFLDIRIRTHLAGGTGPKGPDTRNHINVLSADVVIILPGGDGTKAEYELAIDAGKRAFVYLAAGEMLGASQPYTAATLHDYGNARNLAQCFAHVDDLLAAVDRALTISGN